jgi:hypothetical protein
LLRWRLSFALTSVGLLLNFLGESKMFKKQKGFTLNELIISILALVVGAVCISLTGVYFATKFW